MYSPPVGAGGDVWLCPHDSVLAAELTSDLPSLEPVGSGAMGFASVPCPHQQKAQFPGSAQMEQPTESRLPVSDVSISTLPLLAEQRHLMDRKSE